MASNRIKGLTVEIGGDTTKLGKALADVEKKSRNLSGELGEINRLLKLDPGNTELLAQKQKVLAEAIGETAKKLDTLKDAEKQVQKQFKKGEASEEQVRALQREIITTEKKMASYERATKETADALRNLDESTEDAERSTGELGEKMADLAKGGATALAGAVTAVTGALVASAEATRDYRTEMGKLETAFDTAGHSSAAAHETYKALQGVLGETDQAVEAANHLAQLVDNEKDLKTWTDICTGVYATFGSSLPIEGLTEAANETAKTGSLTGALADALNWAGVNEETFQKKLESLTTEQERQTYITETLNGLYSETAEKYREVNEEVIRANEANEAWMDSMSDIGAEIEPILTDVKLMGAAMLQNLVPGVKEVAQAFRGMLNGEDGTQIISKLMDGISTALPKLSQKALDIVNAIVSGIQKNVPIMLERGAELLTKLGEGIRNNLPGLVSHALDIVMNLAQTIYDAAPKLVDMGFELIGNLVKGIMSSLPTLLAKVPEIVSTLANVINHNFPTILMKGVELVWEIIKGIIQAIPDLVKNIPKIIKAIVDVWAAFNWLNLGKNAINGIKNGIKSMVGSVKTAGQNVLNTITNALNSLPGKLLTFGKNAVTNLGNALKSGLGFIKSGASNILRAIINALTSLPSNLLNLGKNAITNLGNGVTNMRGWITEKAKSIGTAVLNKIKELPNQVKDVGKNLVTGLWSGINDKLDWIKSKIKSFTKSCLNAIKDFFGVHSPSTETAWIGDMLDQGLAKGIEDNAKDPIKAMKQLSGDMLDEAESMNGLTLERRLSHTFAEPAGPTAESGMLDKLDRILAAIERGQILTLDGDAVVGGIADRMDAALGRRRALVARGAV